MLTIEKDDFYLNGEKFRLLSGSIHYFRVPREYWEDRLLKLKLAGFNTVETYVCWNLHEPQKGKFDFSDMLDIAHFLKTAQNLGLYAIVRPSPYICAEWDFGGLPAWLLKDKNMRLRCNYAPYLTHVEDFYRELFKILTPMQITKGGNIIAMQIENEYGSYGNDKNYLLALEKMMRDFGTEVLLFTSDGPQDDMLTGGTLPHIFKTGNFGSAAERNFKTLRKHQPKGPMVCCEFWDGWFDHWGERHHVRPAKHLTMSTKSLLAAGGHVNFFMFHGGTNFGFTAGANHTSVYQPTVTSYDYDALLNEWGGYTKKYHEIRAILHDLTGKTPEPLPEEPKKQTIGTVRLTESASLFQNLERLGTKQFSVSAEHMEYYDQNFGLILYRHRVKGPYQPVRLFIDGVHDRAHVFVNGELKGIFYRNDKNTSTGVGALKEGDVIDVLVEAMGRVNYGPKLYDRKGVEQIRLNGQVLSDFEVYTLPLDDLSGVDYQGAMGAGPQIMRGTFETQSNAECFVHLKGFGKGLVYINGRNLGRYWKAGPQKCLYLPGCWLKEKNEIVVVELDGCKTPEVCITDRHDLGRKGF